MIARSIFLGINNYFIENPIEGTLINNNTDYGVLMYTRHWCGNSAVTDNNGNRYTINNNINSSNVLFLIL